LYCGIDLHARTMSVCMLNHDGEIVGHRHMPTSPDALLKTIAPYRDQSVLAVAGLFTWYWLADLGAREGMPFVLGQALSMPALHGGQAKKATSDAPNMAVLLRGGMRPHASVSPAEMRATRDLRRRRRPLTRKRAELLPHVQPTNGQYNVPAIGQTSASKAQRAGGAERLSEPAVPQRIEGALALIASDAQLLRALAWTMVQTAKHHDAKTLDVLQTVPGIGTSLSLVRLYARHDIARCPRVPDFVSYGRLGTGAQASAGQHDGTSGTQLGHASLTWAFSAAAVVFLRTNPAGHKSRARFEHKHGQGQA
jgi:hypothetical protein